MGQCAGVLTSPMRIGYAEFGARFVTAAVTESRIEAAVTGMAGRGMTIGPFSIGPAGLAEFVAEGSVGAPHIVRHGPHVTFEVMVPVSLGVDVTLGGQRLRVEAVVEIDLTLHARTADPLVIVIDIPPITARDVSFVMRAQAIGSVWELLLGPIALRVQREVANRLNTMLAESRGARVFDVDALVHGSTSVHRARARFDWIGYDEFGRRFFPRIVTAERVREVVEHFAGRGIDIGPLRTGPRHAVQVAVRGTVRLPRLTDRAGDDPVSFDLMIPVSLELIVDALKSNRYHAEVKVPLVLVARAADPLLIVIDVSPPAPEDITVEVRAEGWRATALGAVAGIRGQIAVQVASVVRRELADMSGRTIDVTARLAGIDTRA